jgi:hypothetical protein
VVVVYSALGFSKPFLIRTYTRKPLGKLLKIGDLGFTSTSRRLENTLFALPGRGQEVISKKKRPVEICRLLPEHGNDD